MHRSVIKHNVQIAFQINPFADQISLIVNQIHPFANQIRLACEVIISTTILSVEEVSSKIKFRVGNILVERSSCERLTNVIDHSVATITSTDYHNYYYYMNIILQRL